MLEQRYMSCWIVFFATLPTFVYAQLPELTDQTFVDYQAAIEPTDGETEFLKINWYSRLHRAVREAHRSDKPLLIYVMNGHPLACT